jgi:hypothetical protein
MGINYTKINKADILDLLYDEKIVTRAIERSFEDTGDVDVLNGDVIYELSDILEKEQLYKQGTMDGVLVGPDFKKRVIKAVIDENC